MKTSNNDNRKINYCKKEKAKLFKEIRKKDPTGLRLRQCLDDMGLHSKPNLLALALAWNRIVRG